MALIDIAKFQWPFGGLCRANAWASRKGAHASSTSSRSAFARYGRFIVVAVVVAVVLVVLLLVVCW